jgi:peptidoglycan/xylan/chitin deacetylase (PgdA/CDA1 family)
MFFDADITGDRLPPKTLCLTFDDGPGKTDGDGPGPRTEAIGAYLFEQGIPATFFVVGKCLDGLEHVLDRLNGQGHLLANHTFDHPDLTRDVSDAQGLVDQLIRTDERIRTHNDGKTVFFRPPYGAWRPSGSAASVVARRLNESHRLAGYVGPIMCDVGGGDWAYWRDCRSPQECARDYLDQIERAGRGIVLMHDSTADIDEVRRRNQTYQLTTELIPLLKAKGYRFVRLDAVPQVASAALVSYQVTLQADGGLFVSGRHASDEIWVDGRPASGDLPLGVVVLDSGKVALRATQGMFLSAPSEGVGPVLANAPAVGDHETFEQEDLEEGRVVLRTVHGAYLGCETPEGGRLTAQLGLRKRCSIFKSITWFG